MSKEVSYKDIAEFIFSDDFKVETKANQAIIDSIRVNPQLREEGLLPPGRVPLRETAGGQALQQALVTTKLSRDDRVRLWTLAEAKYLASASGDVAVVVRAEGRSTNFIEWRLPNVLSNKQITSLNNVSSAELRAFWNQDQSQTREIASQVILRVVSGRRPVSSLQNATALLARGEQDRELAIINGAVRKMIGNELDTLNREQASISVRREIAARKWEAYEAQRKALGPIANGIILILPYFKRRVERYLELRTVHKDELRVAAARNALEKRARSPMIQEELNRAINLDLRHTGLSHLMKPLADSRRKSLANQVEIAISHSRAEAIRTTFVQRPDGATTRKQRNNL